MQYIPSVLINSTGLVGHAVGVFYAMSDSCLDKKEKTNSVLLTSQENPFANKQEKEEAYSCSSITNSSQPSAEVGGKPDSWSKESSDSSNAGNKNDYVDSFEHMGLREPLLRGIYSYGFELPSAIQQRAIIPCCKGQDVIAQAQSGTGKTATFAVGILQQLDMAVDQCQVHNITCLHMNYALFIILQALVLAPTRELARQTETVLLALGDYMKVNVFLVVGGEKVRDMMAALNSGVHVVVGKDSN